jgi:hypothetical protein
MLAAFSILVMVIAGLFAFPASAAPQELTLAEVRTKVDNWLAPRWQVVQDRQAAYFAANGRYWQGLRTHTFDLEYTSTVDAEAQADALDSAPTDQIENWLAVFPEFGVTPIPAVLIVDVYDGPLGHGYVAQLWVKFNGNIYTRSAQVGPEDWRAAGWQQVTATAVQE